MLPNLEDFRALARSSPWLWRTLQFRITFDQPLVPEEATLRAFVLRPRGLRIEALDGRLLHAGWPERADLGMPPVDGETSYRTDGLVARRPGDVDIPERYDDPLFQNYRWVAMLHPFELADGVDPEDDGRRWSPARSPISVIDGPREVDHHGRPAWEAQIITTPSYRARCSCCPLLNGAQGDRTLAAEGGWSVELHGDLPVAWLVRLDRHTGTVVALSGIGGSSPGGGWVAQIEHIDRDMPRSMFRH